MAPDATAGTVAFTPTPPVVGPGGAFDPVNLGLVFTANTNFPVDALGFFFQAGLIGLETVGLYTSSGTLLTSAVVPLSAPLVSGYLFQSITPVALKAGNQYTVDAFVGNNFWSYGSTPPNQAADVTYNYHDYLYTGSLAFPFETVGAAGGPEGTYYGPNFEIGGVSPVPEPASLLLLGAGLFGLAAVRCGKAS